MHYVQIFFCKVRSSYVENQTANNGQEVEQNTNERFLKWHV